MSQQGAVHLLETKVAQLEATVATLTKRIETIEGAATSGKTKAKDQASAEAKSA